MPPQSVQGMQIDPSQYVHTKPEHELQLTKVSSVSIQNARLKPVQPHMVQPIMGNDPRVNSLVNQQSLEHRQHRPQTMIAMQSYAQGPAPSAPSNTPMRTNLITVPIQDTTISTHELHTQQSHHYYPPPPPPQVGYGGYNVPPPVSQTQQYYPQPQHPTQVSYVAPPPQQQQYVSSAPASIRPSPTGYIQESQYGPPPSQPPPPQPQWSQHQQQFYR